MTTNHRPGMGFRFCKSSTSMATCRVICMFSHGPCALECSLADAWYSAAEISWVVRKSCGFSEASGTFRMASVFFFGWLKILHYLRTRTPIETFWHFCGFIAWKRAVFDHIGEKSGSLFLLQLREARWNDAAETHAVTHGYLPSQYPIIFYFWVVQ